MEEITTRMAIYKIVKDVQDAAKDPEFQSLGCIVFLLLVLGTVVYSLVEGWAILDAFYFSVTTLSTVGYGGFTPNTVVGKIFTVFYIFIGVVTFFSFLSLIERRAKDQGRDEQTKRKRSQ